MKEPGSDLLATIRTQPGEAHRLLDDRAVVVEAAAALRGSSRIFLAGTGTSHHGCLAGEQMLRSAGFDARAVLSFELAAYPPARRPGDSLIVVSHRGTKRFTIGASEGWGHLLRVLVTGIGSPMTGDHTLTTVAQERSPVHTASHTAALIRLAQLAAVLAPDGEIAAGLEGLPAAMGAAIATDRQCAEVVAGLNLDRPLFFAGAGPSWATALEGALKIREAAFVTAEGHELENLLHGPLISFDRRDTVVLIAQPGPSLERTLEAASGLAEIGVALLAVGPAAEEVAGARWAIVTPTLPEVLAPSVNVIPLQWLAYHGSRARGVDADSFRRDEPTYLAAQGKFQL